MANPTTILIVDDSRASRMMISAWLQKLVPDALLHEAANGADALALLESKALEPDLAILDKNMPGMDGLELAAHIGQRHPATQRALLTANVQDATRRDAAAIGVHFFRKPVGEIVIRQVLGLVGR